jgi:hypothetical protein
MIFLLPWLNSHKNNTINATENNFLYSTSVHKVSLKNENLFSALKRLRNVDKPDQKLKNKKAASILLLRQPLIDPLLD